MYVYEYILLYNCISYLCLAPAAQVTTTDAIVRAGKELESNESVALTDVSDVVPSIPVLEVKDMEYSAELAMTKIGVSFISEKLLEELLYAELGQLTLDVNTRGDLQTISFKISDIQVDSQLVSHVQTIQSPLLDSHRRNGVRSRFCWRTEEV